MSLGETIHPNNVVKAAQFILELDKTMIEERYWPDLQAAIYWLKDSLDHYLHPLPEQRFNGLSAIDNLEIALKTLLEAVRSVLPCLTEQACRHFLRCFLGLQVSKKTKNWRQVCLRRLAFVLAPRRHALRACQRYANDFTPCRMPFILFPPTLTLRLQQNNRL